MRTQSKASGFADMFNREAAALILASHRHLVPIIEFLCPLIFELEDQEEGATHNVLVEPLIQGEFSKFCDNKGNLQPELQRDFHDENRDIDVTSAALLLGRKLHLAPKNKQPNDAAANGLLGMIEEVSEDEGSGEDDDDHDSSTDRCFDASTVQPIDYLAAFSHFTYVRSSGEMMVVDLQGSLQERQPNKAGRERPKFLLTDPALHTDDGLSNKNYGRTNLGRRGMNAFFKTHQCNAFCRLLNLKDKSKQNED
jgi:hypothetical protein